MKIGLFFGSFNPVHTGHMAIANYMVEFSDLDQVWFVVSPHNPLKKKEILIDDYARLELVEMAIEGDDRFLSCDIEFQMPKPSYTIDTLSYLSEKYPDREFVIIMGSDGLKTFHKWKSADTIIENFIRYVYPRLSETDKEILKHKNIKLMNAPRMEISSTFIREAIANKRDIRHLLPVSVFNEINNRGYYL